MYNKLDQLTKQLDELSDELWEYVNDQEAKGHYEKDVRKHNLDEIEDMFDAVDTLKGCLKSIDWNWI